MHYLWRYRVPLVLSSVALFCFVGLAMAGNKSLRGTVVSVDKEEKTIVVTDSFSGEEKTLKFNKATKFYEEKSKPGDIGSVKVGQTISVMYDPDLGNKVATFRVLSGPLGDSDAEPKVAKNKKKKSKSDDDDSEEPKTAKKSDKKDAKESDDSGEEKDAKPSKSKVAFGEKGAPKEGSLVPEIAGKDLDGKAFKLSDYSGKVILIDFWAGW